MKKIQEEINQKPQTLCVTCKTFFGNSQTQNMCSKCFKLHQDGQQLLPTLNSVIDSIKQTCQNIQDQKQTSGLEEEKEIKLEKQKDKTKCFKCNRKVGIIPIYCRCGYIYCSKHRHSEDHQCTFNFGKLNRDKLQKEIPLIKKQKLDKI